MKTAAVILNYNDAEQTIAAARRIEAFKSIDSIVIVDNASSDDSIERLLSEFSADTEKTAEGKIYGSSKIHLIKNKRNGGYGYGNNRGVRFATEHCGAELAIIANPDAEFSEELAAHMQEVFKNSPSVGAVGAVMKLDDTSELISYKEFLSSGWRERDFKNELTASAPVLKRLYKNKINFSEKYYRFNAPAIPVYAVHGSLLMVSTEAFLKCGGYDEEMFLYMEEYALAARLKEYGMKTIMLAEVYRHEGSHSISGAGHGAVKRQKFRQASERIYYRKYLGAGKCDMILARLLQKIVLLETYLFVK